jgi:hypothetical protein
MKAMLILNDQSVVVGVDIVPIYIDIGESPHAVWASRIEGRIVLASSIDPPRLIYRQI